MKTYKFLITLIIFGLFSCEVINPNEDIPSYIKINNFNVDEVGTAKITDAWVYIDNELQGIYELPNTIAILKKDNQSLFIAPGIKENGISASRKKYPFYVWHQEDVFLTPNDTITINPFTNYRENCIHFEDDFTTGTFFQNELLPGLEISTDTALMIGSGYGTAILDGSTNVFSCTSEPQNLPKDREVYMEMDYKCNSEFYVNLYKFGPEYALPVPVMLLNPKEDWNKIYINLTNVISGESEILFSLSFFMLKDSTLTQSELNIDNVKILYEE